MLLPDHGQCSVRSFLALYHLIPLTFEVSVDLRKVLIEGHRHERSGGNVISSELVVRRIFSDAGAFVLGTFKDTDRDFHLLRFFKLANDVVPAPVDVLDVRHVTLES